MTIHPPCRSCGHDSHKGKCCGYGAGTFHGGPKGCECENSKSRRRSVVAPMTTDSALVHALVNLEKACREVIAVLQVKKPAPRHGYPVDFANGAPPSASVRVQDVKMLSSFPAGKGELRILAAIAQHKSGVTREQLTVLTGYKRSSRTTYLQRLRSEGWIEAHGTMLHATSAGI